MEYVYLFASALAAATILPFYSEGLLYYYLVKGLDPFWLTLTATVGNTLGAVINWWLGLFILKFQDRRWFYFKTSQIERAQHWFNKFGRYSLLLAWLPIGGDALTLVAGIMRVPLGLFVLLVGAGKLARYVFVVFLQNGLQ